MAVVLSVNGLNFSGWKSVSIQQSMETLAGGFDLSISERWPGQETERPIKPGDKCTLKIQGTTVITGYVDQVNPSYDDKNHEVQVSGRDASGDLVDCSAINSPGQWSNQTMLQIAQALCQPFGINISVDAGVNVSEPFKTFSIQQGETVHEALSRMAKMRAVLILSDGSGGLRISRSGVGRSGTALVEGKNILKASATFDFSERFSKVIVKGQNQGTDNTNADSNRGAKGVAVDSEVTRYRPLLVQAEGKSTTAQAQERAPWEVATRKSKAVKANVTTPTWFKGNGQLWRVNERVFLNSPLLHLNEEMLVSAITFTQDDSGGTLTDLTLVRPESFTILKEANSV